MKNVHSLFAAVVLFGGLAMGISSCSDNNDEPAQPAAKSIEGTYTGDMTVSVAGSESVFEDIDFNVVATDDASVDITVDSFGNPPMQIPEFTITGVVVSGTDGIYALAPTEFRGTTADGRAFSGTTRGAYENGILSVDVSLQYGAMPMPLICSFSAPKNK